jgi:phage shock protein A
MTADDEPTGAAAIAATRRQLRELHAVIEQELANVRDRIADLRRHEATAQRFREQARELLRLDPERLAPGEEE